MKRFFCLVLSVMFSLGILFPVSSTGGGKSPFVEQIKKIFGYSDGVAGTEGTKKSKAPLLEGGGKSEIFQGIRNIFHYFPEDTKRPKPKKYPFKFDKALQKELRYPRTEETK